MCRHLWLVQHQFLLLCLACTMHCVTKATSIQFINGNKPNSCRMDLINHIRPISHNIMPLVINDLGGEHTRIPTCKQKLFQESSHTWPYATHAWFKKGAEITIKRMQVASKYLPSYEIALQATLATICVFSC